MKKLILPRLGIRVEFDVGSSGGGQITSDLKDTCQHDGSYCDGTCVSNYNAAIDAIESIVLAHACAGVDIQSASYVQGIDSALTEIENQFDAN